MISIKSEERPLGRFFVFNDEPTYKLKRIEVDPWGRPFYQYYHKRSKEPTIKDIISKFTSNGMDKEYFKVKTVFIDVQRGTHSKEDDIVLIEDDYKRA